jgi:ankyrin repeat protein
MDKQEKLNDDLINAINISDHLVNIKSLIEQGADIHVANDYAFRKNVEKRYIKIIKYLVEQGANINAFENYALRLSASYGHLEVVKYLVEQGANIYAQEDYALRYSSENGLKAEIEKNI